MRKVYYLFKSMAFVALLTAMACAASQGNKAAEAPECYELVWADEFDVDGAPNDANWSYQLMRKGQVNNEEQEYVNSLDNAWVEDGILHVKAIKEGDRITSARLITRGKQEWLYGRVEARIKLPKGKGVWPAFWMMPAKSSYGGWPNSGEIDILEFVGYMPGVVHATVHTADYNHVINTQKGTKTELASCSDEFHVYSLEWTAERIDIAVDDNVYFSFENDGAGTTGTWPFNHPFYIILNVAFGGGWGGAEGVDYSVLPCDMQVDWVRVYQKTE